MQQRYNIILVCVHIKTIPIGFQVDILYTLQESQCNSFNFAFHLHGHKQLIVGLSYILVGVVLILISSFFLNLKE